MKNGPTILAPANDAAIAQAADALANGRLVALPTETVYGLAADAGDPTAVAKIFAIKGRPTFNPLIAHVTDVHAATQLVDLSPDLKQLAASFWPGPLTLVATRRDTANISALATAGLPTLAVRVPAHPVTRRVLQKFAAPLVAPSANRSGRPSPTTANHVHTDFIDVDELTILDGGSCDFGLESTIVTDDPNHGVTILRPGAITAEQIEKILGKPVANRLRDTQSVDTKPTAPGQLLSHYAPTAHLRLNATTLKNGEVLIAFGPPIETQQKTDNPTTIYQLSESASLSEAAARLFEVLRALDRDGRARAAVMPIPNTGLGRAINDRLQRAAAPRSS